MTEIEMLHAMRDRFWSAEEWTNEARFTDDETRCNVPAQTGEELPGSWHQQANGGVRRWATVSGEIAESR